jgi:hypothetical protein
MPMAPPSVLLVIMLAPAPPRPVVVAFEAAARRLLMPSLDVHVAAMPERPSDAVALAQARSAAGIVELSWDDEHRRASLHCYIPSSERWIDRTMAFDAVDRESERGRLVGFAIASMFTLPAAVDTPPAASKAASEPSRDSSSTLSAPVERTHHALELDEPSPVASRQARSLQFAGLAAKGIGGDGGGLGASLSALNQLSESLYGRAVLSARLGDVPAAQANTRTMLAGLGLLWSVLPNQGWLDLGLRLDGLVGWLQVSHFSEDDVVPAHEHRWLVGADAVVTVEYRLSELVALYVGGGLEAMLGSTAIYTHGRRVATVPVGRAVSELGLRTHF